MNINFHYFTLKFIASRSGYTPEEAQLIASTCQFVNDNNIDIPMYLKKSQLSEEIIKRNLYTLAPDKGADMCKVPILLTALDSDLDDAAFQEALKVTANEEDLLIPFYYFPEYQIEENTDYEVTAITSLQSNDVFKNLFNVVRGMYDTTLHDRGLGKVTPEKINALRRLGILMHIASDSFVYDPFNGYASDVNAWKLVEAKDVKTYNIITDRYNPDKYSKYPNVGKYRTGGVNDDYNVQFVMQNKKNMRSCTRNNNDRYYKAAQAVYKLLKNFKGLEPNPTEWRDNIQDVLLKGWDTDKKSYADLKAHWEKVTQLSSPNEQSINASNSIDFNYDADVVRQTIADYDVTVKPESQSYFDFILMVDDTRKAVIYKEASQMDLRSVENGIITCNISEPQFWGDIYTLKVDATLTTKIDSLAMIVTVMDTKTQVHIYTNTYQYKNTLNIGEKVSLAIPENDEDLMIRVDFGWRDVKGPQKKGFSKEYSVVGNANVLTSQTLIHPVSKTGRPVIQVVNGTDSFTADYNYPMNAMYISQEGPQELDLFTPIDFKFTLNEMFKITEISTVDIHLIDSSGKNFKYCNNSKFISITKADDGGELHLHAESEWKNRILTEKYPASIAKMTFEINILLEVSSEKEEGFRNVLVTTKKDTKLVNTIEYMWNL